MDYKQKYLKYKTKYLVEKTMMDIKQDTLNTLKQMKGGSNDTSNDNERTSEQIVEYTNKTTSQIKELTTEMKVGDNLVIFIYATWCGYCRAYYDSYKDLVEKANTENITRVISHSHDDNKQNLYYPATGFPTLLLVTKINETTFKQEELSDIDKIDIILQKLLK